MGVVLLAGGAPVRTFRVLPATGSAAALHLTAGMQVPGCKPRHLDAYSTFCRGKAWKRPTLRRPKPRDAAALRLHALERASWQRLARKVGLGGLDARPKGLPRAALGRHPSAAAGRQLRPRAVSRVSSSCERRPRIRRQSSPWTLSEVRVMDGRVTFRRRGASPRSRSAGPTSSPRTSATSGPMSGRIPRTPRDPGRTCHFRGRAHPGIPRRVKLEQITSMTQACGEPR